MPARNWRLPSTVPLAIRQRLAKALLGRAGASLTSVPASSASDCTQLGRLGGRPIRVKAYVNKRHAIRPKGHNNTWSSNHRQLASEETLPLRLPLPSALIRPFQQFGFAIAESVLPQTVCSRFRAHATYLAQAGALEINKQGTSGATALHYAVVPGEIVEKEWLEMFTLYRSPTLQQWIRTITRSKEIFQSNHLRSAININVLSRAGELYPWHFDAVPYTLILYLSDSAPEDGGALQIRNVRAHLRKTMTYLPHSGDLVLMDGTRCYHRITALRRDHLRISVPMVFPESLEHSRPADLDSFLYDRAA